MEQHSEKQLEELIHRELRKLPDLPAPDTLISRVRSALAAQTRQPWWQRPMLTWPIGLRIAFIVLLVGVVAFACVYRSGITYSFDVLVQKIQPLFTPMLSVFEQASALVSAGLVVVRALSNQFMIYAVLLMGVMYLACIGLGTLYFRVTFANR